MSEQEKRKKVIKGLECCSAEDKRSAFCHEYDCPYRDYEECPMNLMRDALDLLKAQEPVKPIKNDIFYYCGACKYAFTSAKQKFCSYCGRKVKWE